MSTHNICFYGEITKVIPKLFLVQQLPSLPISLPGSGCKEEHILAKTCHFLVYFFLYKRIIIDY